MVRILSFGKRPLEAEGIRIEVFMKEQGFAMEFDNLDEISTHLVLFEGNTPCGTVRFYEEEGRYHIGRLAVAKPYRKKGYGKALMKEAERLILASGGKRIILSAQKQAIPFYEALGYRKQGEFYLDEGCPHIQMTKVLD